MVQINPRDSSIPTLSPDSESKARVLELLCYTFKRLGDGGSGCVSVVESPSDRHEAWGSSPSTARITGMLCEHPSSVPSPHITTKQQRERRAPLPLRSQLKKIT